MSTTPKGVTRANEAIDCMLRVPKNDPQRDCAFEIVGDWINTNAPEGGTLSKLAEVKLLLSKATNFDEVKEIRDKAEAMRMYAKAANESLDRQNQCAALKLEAERRAGEMLGTAVKAGNPQLSHDDTIALNDIGVTRTQSSRWQRIASIPEQQFREHVESTVAAGKELTTAGALRLAQSLAAPASNGKHRKPPPPTLDDGIIELRRSLVSLFDSWGHDREMFARILRDYADEVMEASE